MRERRNGGTATARAEEPGTRTVALTRSTRHASPKAAEPSGVTTRPANRAHTGEVASQTSTFAALPSDLLIAAHDGERP